MDKDRRLFTRFNVRDDVYITFTENFASGKVRDISHGGFSFEYLRLKDEDDLYIPKMSGVNIWTPTNLIKIYDIPCELVYDYMEFEKNLKYDYEFRRCGVRFLHIDKFIKFELDKIVQ